MKKKMYLAALVIAVGIAAWFFLRPKNAPKTTKETAKVERKDLSRIVTSTGTVEPVINVEVGTQVSGIISKIYVDYNSVVKKGQILAEIDPTVLKSELDAQTATVNAAKVEFEFQTKNYNRAKGLHEKEMISDTEFEEAYYNYEKARNSYNKSRSELNRIKTNLGYATITSPIDGIVLSRAVDEGQTVAASFNTPTLFTIANDLTRMQVIANVDEADIGQVEAGQKVTFDVDAFPDDVFEGEVTQVRLEASTTSNVVTYEVVINAPNPELKLKPGLTANVTIKTLERNNVLTVPSKALKFRQQGDSNQKKVWAIRNGKEVAVDVTTGYDDRINCEILSGLKEGETIIVDENTVIPMSDKEATGTEKSPFMQGPPGSKKK